MLIGAVRTDELIVPSSKGNNPLPDNLNKKSDLPMKTGRVKLSIHNITHAMSHT